LLNAVAVRFKGIGVDMAFGDNPNNMEAKL
jgi:hypothetical protein